jgi:hypothetical protein
MLAYCQNASPTAIAHDNQNKIRATDTLRAKIGTGRIRPFLDSKRAMNEKPGMTATGLLANMNKGKSAMRSLNQKLTARSVHL